MKFRQGCFNDDGIVLMKRYKYLPQDICTLMQDILDSTPSMATVNKIDELAGRINHFCYQRESIIKELMEKKDATCKR